jgi:hypothetical protein
MTESFLLIESTIESTPVILPLTPRPNNPFWIVVEYDFATTDVARFEFPKAQYRKVYGLQHAFSGMDRYPRIAAKTSSAGLFPPARRLNPECR